MYLRVQSRISKKTIRTLERKAQSRIHKDSERLERKEAANLQIRLKISQYEAISLIKILYLQKSKREPLIAALGSSDENRQLSAELGKTRALIYSRASAGSVLNSRDIGQKLNTILDAVILAANGRVSDRDYMIDFLVRLADALKNDTKRLDLVLGEYASELVD